MSCLSISSVSWGSGKISLDDLLHDDECSFPLLIEWDNPTLPDCFRFMPASLLVWPLALILSCELRFQLPRKAALHDRLDEVFRSLIELKLPSLTTLNGFSRAFKTRLISGRLEGLGWRHALATIATDHISSSKSSSIIKDGSTIFDTSSLSRIVMKGRSFSNHSFVETSSKWLAPTLPVTSSSKTLPKQYTSYVLQLVNEVPVHVQKFR